MINMSKTITTEVPRRHVWQFQVAAKFRRSGFAHYEPEDFSPPDPTTSISSLTPAYFTANNKESWPTTGLCPKPWSLSRSSSDLQPETASTRRVTPFRSGRRRTIRTAQTSRAWSPRTPVRHVCATWSADGARILCGFGGDQPGIFSEVRGF